MKTTRIEVNGETWEVPRGFGDAYRRVATFHLKGMERRAANEMEAIADMLVLIGYTVLPATVAAWPLRKRVEAWVYASNVHLRASDNLLQAHPKPEWLPDPWKGPVQGEGIFATNPTPIGAAP